MCVMCYVPCCAQLSMSSSQSRYELSITRRWRKMVQTVIRLGNTVKEFLISVCSTVFDWLQFKISKISKTMMADKLLYSVFCWHLFLTSSFDTKSFQEDPSQPQTMSRFQMTIVCFCMSPSLGTTRLLNRRTRNTQSTLLCPNWKQLLSIERTIIRMLSLSLQAFISCYTYAYFSLNIKLD